MISMPWSVCLAIPAAAPRHLFSEMLKKNTLCALCAVLLFAIQGQAQQSLQVLHNHVRPAVSSGQAVLVGPLPATQKMQLTIVLPLRNQPALTGLLGQLYDPSSPNYRHFLSVDQFTEQFGPTAEDYQAVVNFAQANGFTVTGMPANRLIVPIEGTTAQVEAAFKVRMNNYQHPTENRTFFSPDREPSLALNVPVAHIAGLNNYSLPHPMVTKSSEAQSPASTSAVGSGPGNSYLASDMRAAYYSATVPTGATVLTGSGQTVGVVEFDGYNISDVTSSFNGAATSSANGSNYLLAYTPAAGGTTYNIPVNNVLLDGATGAPCQFLTSGCDDTEEALDIVQAIGMAPGLSQVRVYIGNSDADMLNAIVAENMAQQLSISWTWEPDDPSTDDFIFQEMAAQGQSVFAASGDYGAFDPGLDNFYPAEDAWVTAVGGTDLITNGAGGAWSSETAWNQSGGGISPDGIPIPSWQTGVADAANDGSTTLRNVPDVAAEANFDNYACGNGSCETDLAGTSFAAPRWAGFTALVNQQAMAGGNPIVGFINPEIYAIGEGSSYNNDFHDITSGSNNLGFYDVTTYNAVSGYDLVTGWGSPAGQNLVNALAPPALAGFQLSASPSSLTVNPGASGTTTISVQDVGGFTGSVSLSVSGLPSGASASFTANSTTGASVLTLTVSSSAIRGSYLVSVTGASGPQTASTSIALLVNAPGFAIAPSLGNLMISPGTSVQTIFTVTDYAGFTGSVNFAVTSSLPSGVYALWSPGSSPTTSVLILSASNSATQSIHSMLTITGTSGGLSATATVALTVEGPKCFLDISPIPFNIIQGSSLNATLTLVPEGDLTANGSLSAVSLPSGVTASFNPVTVSPGGTSILTLTASSSAPVEESWVELLASAGNCSASNSFQTLVLATQPPNFNIAISPAFLSVSQGSSVTEAVTVNPLGGFIGSVNLSVPANYLPAGVTASFSPNPTTGSSILTISASTSAAVGAGDELEILGASGALTSVATAFLTVTPPPNFTLSATPASLTVSQGTSGISTIAVSSPTGVTSSVTLAASGLPSGVTAAFATNPTTATSVLTLTASGTAAVGIYNVIITGTSGAYTGTTNLSLNIVLPSSFTPLSANFGAVNIGTASPVQTFTYAFGSAATLGSTAVLTQGATGLDFVDAGSDTCAANTTYSSGQSCTVNVIFAPKFAGFRYGALVLYDTSGNVIDTASLQGTGQGPQLGFLPAAQSNLGSGYDNPMGVAVDGRGNVYVGDETNGVVKEILAVDGTIPSSPTILTLGSFSYPHGVAVDAAGNVYVADLRNNAVKEILAVNGSIPASPTIRTLGSGFSYPWGVAVDHSGNVYVAEPYSNTISEIVAVNGTIPLSPTIRTLGSGFNFPSGVAVDGSGNVYVGDSENGAVKEMLAVNGSIPASPTIKTLGSGYEYPGAVAVDGNGNVYVADYGNDTAKEILAVNGGIPASPTINTLVSGLNAPESVAVDSSLNVYIADTGNNRILKLDFADPPSLTFATTVEGSTSSDSPKTVKVENVGNAALDISGVSYPPNFPEGSHATTECAVTTSLPTNGSCTLTIDFTPLAGGQLYSSLVLTDNALNGAPSTQSISLTGAGQAPPSFTLSATPGSLTVIQGGSGTSTIAVSGQNGFAGSVTLIPSGLPSGVTASFGANPTTGSSVLTLTASNSAAVGAVTVTITGTSGSLTATTTIALTVNPPPSFTLSATPASLTVIQGASGTSTIAVSGQNGFTGGVQLAASGLPGGMTASFTPNPVTGTSALTLTASSSVAAGTYNITVTGTSGTLTASAFLILTIIPPPGFTPSSANLGSINIGTASPVQTLTYNFGSAVTLASIAVLTQGASGLDFADAGSDTCAVNTAYSAGQSCTMNVIFTPRFAGTRFGALVLNGNNGNVIATGYLQGTGVGPQVNFLPGAQSVLPVTGLSTPTGVAVDASGNVYIVDSNNSRLLKEALSAGNYTQSTIATGLLAAYGVAVDGGGNVYVADTGNNRVLMETPAAGSYTQSVIASGVGYPMGVAVDGGGNVYITDTGNGEVLEETLSAGSYTQSTIVSGLSNPAGVAVDGSGNVYIADAGNGRVLKETLSAGSYTQSTLPAAGQITPQAISVDGLGNVYFEDALHDSVVKETLSAGSYVESTVVSGLNAGVGPFGVAVNGSGNLYIGYAGNNQVLKEDFSDPPSLTFASTAYGATSADSPQTVSVENVGNAALSFSVPFTGNNPSIAANFTLNSSGASACPLLSSGSSTPGTLAAGASCQLPISFTPTAEGALSGSLVITDNNLNAAAPSYASQSIALSGTGTQATPTITWATPAAITYGTALSGTQLNASSTVAGTFTYSPAAGTVLGAGQQTLTVSFAPNDTTDYAAASAAVTLTVNQATPPITWPTPAAITYGTPLSATQLDASSTVAGTFTYSPAAGTVLGAGQQTLTVTLAPTDAIDYTTATASVTLTVNKATPPIIWPTPAAITYGTALSGTQLDASSTVAGTFTYSPAAGTVLGAGQQTLTVTLAPTDAIDYTTATASVTLTVNKATPPITWPTPAAITYGTALSGTQLDASSTVAGTFTYSPAAGTVLGAGQQTLTVTLAPTDAIDYTTATASVTLTVNKAVLTITWPTPAAVNYGTALSATQLDASSTAAGTFAYSPAAGTVLAVGSHTLTVTLTPTSPANYTTATATATVTLTVNKATPLITWATPAAITYGTALSATQLDASSTVAGTFTYSPAAKTVLSAGAQTLSVTFAPTNTTDYTTATSSVTLTVNKATPAITWATPKAITYGTALSGTQLDASSTVAGTFTYSPATGTVLTAGSQTLSVALAPTNATDYTTAADSVTLTVNKATPTVKLIASASSVTSGTSVTFTATLTGGGVKPTGTVTFLDGTTQLGTGTLNGSGVATFATSTLAVGKQSITASYGGDGNYLTATSTAVTVTVAAK
jgi:sugar lactone lactonase YvrE